MRTNAGPDWTAALDHLHNCLHNPREKWRRNERDLTESLMELNRLASDVRPYDNHMVDPWRSAEKDCTLSENWTGSKFSKLINRELRAVLKSLVSMPLRNPAAMDQRRIAISEACEKVIAKINSPDGVSSTWHDLLAEISGRRVDFIEVARRRDLFMSTASLHGHDLATYGDIDLAASVIADIRMDVSRLIKLTNSCLSIYAIDGDERSSGVPSDVRIELLNEYWKLPLVKSDQVIWFHYSDAALSRPWEIHENIQLFQSDWLGAAIRRREATYDNLPGEIRNDPDRFLELLEGRDTAKSVFARVSVGRVLTSEAHRKAETEVQCILSSALSMLEQGWLLTGTTIHVVEGKIHRWTTFRPGTARSDHWRPSQELDLDKVRAATRGANAPLIADVDIEWTLDSIEAIRRGARMSPSGRLALAVQAIERVNATTVRAKGWVDFVRQYLREHWVVDEVVSELTCAARFASTEGGGRWLSDSSARELHTDIRERLNGNTADNGVSPASLREECNKLLQILQPESLAHVRLKWAARSYSKTKGGSHIRKTQAEFDQMLTRVQRYRNAAVHGGQQSSDAVAWCATFAEELARMALSLKLSAYLQGNPVEKIIDEEAGKYSWRTTQMEAGKFDDSFGISLSSSGPSSTQSSTPQSSPSQTQSSTPQSSPSQTSLMLRIVGRCSAVFKKLFRL